MKQEESVFPPSEIASDSPPSQPSFLLEAIKNKIANFEREYGEKSAYFLVLFCALLCAFITNASQVYMPGIPLIEILFVMLVVAFLLNYSFIRQNDLQPFLSNEIANFGAKVSSLYQLFSVLLFVFAVEYCNGEINTILFVFSFSWLLVVVFEKREDRSQSLASILLRFVVVYVLIYAILQPNLFPEYTAVKTHVIEAESRSHLLGVIAVLASGVLFGLSNSTLRTVGRTASEPRVTVIIAHLFIYVQAPFLPLFFAMQKIVPPTLPQWICMVFMGVLLLFTVHVYLRVIQIDRTTSSLFVIPSFIAAAIIFAMLLGVNMFGVPTFPKVLAAILILLIGYAGARNPPNDSGSDDEEEKQETRNDVEIPMQDIQIPLVNNHQQD